MEIASWPVLERGFEDSSIVTPCFDLQIGFQKLSERGRAGLGTSAPAAPPPPQLPLPLDASGVAYTAQVMRDQDTDDQPTIASYFAATRDKRTDVQMACLPICQSITISVIHRVDVDTVVAWQRLSSEFLPPCLRRSCIWLSAVCCLQEPMLRRYCHVCAPQIIVCLSQSHGFYNHDRALTPRIRGSVPSMQRGGVEDNVESGILGLVPHYLHHPEFAHRFLRKGDPNDRKRLWKHYSYQSFEAFRYKSPSIDLIDVRSMRPRPFPPMSRGVTSFSYDTQI